ncbi:hypothetical protein NDN13_08170 [Acinetobacter sp. C32I]|uniref:hypothetical protein n=1 Tax=Acinetobacter sp. C32I TaxID=2950074 RepID=UPI0020374E1D|nr:hypothetical protein [Acinetobacter sp. C32I]USA55144.1 hypothetical protein NDN13_08170 [Acinetobacter sp. C32I]
MKKMALMLGLLLSACHQAKPPESLDIQHQQAASDQIKQKVVDRSNKTNVILSVFAYQETADQHLDQQCIWTDDANAMAKRYWSIQPNIELNGYSRFTKDDITLSAVLLRKPIQHCSAFYKTAQTTFAYAVNNERDWVNSIPITSDQLIQNADGTVSIDLDRNGQAEQTYVCLNSESMDVFFKEAILDKSFIHAHVQLSYSIDGGVDDSMACTDQFFSKLGISVKEDPQTGNMVYTAR